MRNPVPSLRRLRRPGTGRVSASSTSLPANSVKTDNGLYVGTNTGIRVVSG